MKRLQYISPTAEELEISTISVLCASPQDGGIEGVDYEDWVLEPSDY